MSAALARRPHMPLPILPQLRGRVSVEAALAPLTWFRVGGPVDLLFRPADEADLATFLQEKPADLPVAVIGVASNLLLRDGGVRGAIVRLQRGFGDIRVEGSEIVAGAGALDGTVAQEAAAAGIEGLEFLSGIPGTIGGALRMNAGAYGTELKDVLVSARAMDPTGRVVELSVADLGLSYRHSDVPDDWIFLDARLRGQAGDPTKIAGRIAEIDALRHASQPVRSRTGGSTFANPPGEKAWQLIDRAGCRGLRIGDAQVSELHTNFLVNLGMARAADLEALGEEVRRRVREMSGIDLVWEIRRIGEAAR